MPWALATDEQKAAHLAEKGPCRDDSGEMAPGHNGFCVIRGFTEKSAEPKKKSPGRPKRDDSAPVSFKGSGKSLKRELGALIKAVNDGLVLLPWTRDDALTQEEGEQLVDALDTAQKSNEKFRGRLEKATSGGGMAPLIIVGFTILFSRLVRHGVIPMPRLEPNDMTPEQQEAIAVLLRAREAARNGVPVYGPGGEDEPQPVAGMGAPRNGNYPIGPG